MPGGLPRNPDIVFGIGQNLTVRWPRIATRKKLKSGASRFHWLGLHLVKRTQRPLAIEQSWQEMQWNKILDWNAKLIFKKFPLPNGWVRRWYYLMIFNVVWGLQMVFDCDGIQCNESPLWNWWLACNWTEPTAKYYNWTGLRACATKRCHRCFQIKFVNIEQGEQNCVVPPSICYCQRSQRALLWAIGHTPEGSVRSPTGNNLTSSHLTRRGRQNRS